MYSALVLSTLTVVPPKLSTYSLDVPLVVIDNADPFVTRYRAELERKVGSLPATGTLILDVKTWPANTRLAKLVDSSATLVCKAPAPFKLPPWCSEWAQARYDKQLPGQAAIALKP